MKKRIQKPAKLMKLSPNSEAYKSKMKRDNLGGSPDIYQRVDLDWRSVQTASVMNIDIDEFFDNHLSNHKSDPAWHDYEIVNHHFIKKEGR